MNTYGFEEYKPSGVSFFVEDCLRYAPEEFVISKITVETAQKLEEDFAEKPTGQTAEQVMEEEKLFRDFGCRRLLLVWEEQENYRVMFFSASHRVRALEFLDALLSEYGLVKGNAEYAFGWISRSILDALLSSMNLANSMEYYLEMTYRYFHDTDVVQAREYAKAHQEEIPKRKRYIKAKKSWAYVKTAEIARPGEELLIKMLENESGLKVVAGEDTYIMIGFRGEVYFISREKFERTYEPSEEALDVFEQMMDFLPEAEKVSDGSIISLDEYARLCYPKPGKGIYAVPLKKRTKVFPANGSDEYFLGKAGDFMVIRADDIEDIYIIDKDVFTETYEEALS